MLFSSNKKKCLFINVYVIQIVVSLACLLKSLQHIDVQKYLVDVDEEEEEEEEEEEVEEEEEEEEEEEAKAEEKNQTKPICLPSFERET